MKKSAISQAKINERIEEDWKAKIRADQVKEMLGL